MTTINRPPADQWGTWCGHGKRIIEPNPDQPLDHTNVGHVVTPWPCDAEECTLDAFEQAMDDAEFEQEQRQQTEYNAIVREGLSGVRW